MATAQHEPIRSFFADSPVFRGDDEPETFSCQLYFFPRELLFSVSWESQKKDKEEAGEEKREAVRSL